MEPTEIARGYCHVCGRPSFFRSTEPVNCPCKRNSFICDSCGSSARNRHLAKTVLETYPSTSLAEFAATFRGSIFVACTSGAVASALSPAKDLVTSEYIDGVSSGQYSDGVLCQDIQRTSFPANRFDLVITEEVLEHVPFPDQAFREIRRILKPGGHHISTIPVKWHLKKSEPRAIMRGGAIVHLHPPEYHGDALRKDGILAFTDYGRDILERYCAVIGESRVLSAHQDAELERDFAIYNNWVFWSQKRRSFTSRLRSAFRYAHENS